MRKKESLSIRKKKSLMYHIKNIIYAIALALLIRIFVIEPFKIPSESMSPSVLKGDMLMANKFVYGIYIPVVNYKIPGFVKPDAGDIILFQSPTYQSPGKWKEIVNFVTFGIFDLDNNMQTPRYFIKRAIGVPGDTITLVDPRQNNFAFQVIRNGEEETFSYSKNPEKDSWIDNDDVNAFAEKGNPAKVQYLKEQYPFFQTREKDMVDNLYIPQKGDELKFILLSDAQTSKEMVENAKENKTPLELSYQIKLKLVVKRENGSKKMNHFDGTISGRTFSVFYYNQRPNTILSPENVYDLLLNRSVQVKVKDDYFLALGDNRDNSEDSRFWGFVPYRYIIGSPMVRYWPLNRFGSVNLKS